MTCFEFYRLTYAQQADLLLQKGTFLQTRSENNFIIDLYELQELLIEIFYQSRNEDPVSVMAYNTLEKLKDLPKRKLEPRLRIRNGSDPFHKGSFAA